MYIFYIYIILYSHSAQGSEILVAPRCFQYLNMMPVVNPLPSDRVQLGFSHVSSLLWPSPGTTLGADPAWFKVGYRTNMKVFINVLYIILL